MKQLALGLVLVALSTSAFAERDGGVTTHGGGERKGSKLRDLIDGGNCIVESGKNFAEKQAPELPQVLKSLESTHWVLSLLLREEIKGLRFCVVAQKLRRTATDDSSSPVQYNESADHQLIAIREDEMVYINREQFDYLDSISRAAFLIHEAMHAYVPMNTPKHDMKVRNIVNVIMKNAESLMSAEQFDLQMEYSAMKECVTTPTDFWSKKMKPAFLTITEDSRTVKQEELFAAVKYIVRLNDRTEDECVASMAEYGKYGQCRVTLANVAIASRVDELSWLSGHPRGGRRQLVPGDVCYGERTRKNFERRRLGFPNH